MKKEYDEALCAKYPKIFADRHASKMKTCMCWGFECDDGWYRLLDSLCECIQSYLDANHEDEPSVQVVATQVKEKYGTLHFYYCGGNELIGGMVWLAERLSASVCEVRGEPGQLRGGGWMRTVCDRHANDSEVACNEELP